MDASLAASEARPNRPVLRVGAIEIPYMSRDAALAVIEASVRDRTPARVAFCNANTMLKALRSARYAQVLKSFLLLNDGIGVDLCSYLFTGRRFDDNLNGTDLVPLVLGRSPNPLAVYLLGGKPGTAEAAAAWLTRAHPRHRLVGCRHGYFTEAEAEGVVADVLKAAPDVLLVGMGNPRQEEFIHDWRGKLDVPVVLAVGAFLDFAAGNVRRAPAILRNMRLEWVFRFVQEPRRLGRRYTVDVALYLFMILRLRVAAGLDGATPPASTDTVPRR